MGGAVQTGKAPVCVHEADDEGDSALLPTSVVNEGCEDKFGMLVRRGNCWYCDEDDDEGDQRCPKREFGNRGQRFAVAV